MIQLKDLLSEVGALKVKSLRGGKATGNNFELGLDKSAIIKVVAMTAILTVAYFIWLEPQLDRLVMAGNALCSGELAFVYGTQTDGRTVWTDTTQKPGQDS